MEIIIDKNGMIVLVMGKYGKGKEYAYDNILIFEGEYKNEKRKRILYKC